ncbi:MAG: hypothetical protein J3K34DRAFT_17445 [Monoraphidium minutum]|nr:MAG: hypothetical protein J3K34DRAFT_17445 [Monoraphidium minutum]
MGPRPHVSRSIRICRPSRCRRACPGRAPASNPLPGTLAGRTVNIAARRSQRARAATCTLIHTHMICATTAPPCAPMRSTRHSHATRRAAPWHSSRCSAPAWSLPRHPLHSGWIHRAGLTPGSPPQSDSWPTAHCKTGRGKGGCSPLLIHSATFGAPLLGGLPARAPNPPTRSCRVGQYFARPATWRPPPPC